MSGRTNRHRVVREEYLNWLLTPPAQRDPSSKKEFAEVNDVAQKTLYNWENEEDFQRELAKIKIKWGAAWHGDLLSELYSIGMQGKSESARINAIRTLLAHLDVGAQKAEDQEVSDDAAKAIMEFLEEKGFKTIEST